MIQLSTPFFYKHWQIILIFLLAVCLRIYAVQGNSVIFWYDQARDFTIVKDIVINNDLKIQGPSASGTNDTIYHGVFYYYLLAPFFILSSGNPQVIAYCLAIVGSTSVIVIYLLGLNVFKSKATATLAAFFLAFSFIGIQQSTWLSNPQLLVITIGIFYLSIWKIFFEKPTFFDFIVAGISLGLSIQGGFFEILLIGSLAAIYIKKSIEKNKILLFSFKEISIFFISFIATISSMILTQILMIHRNVLTWEKLSAVKRETIPAFKVIEDLLELYSKALQNSLIPTGLVLLFLLFLIPIVIGFKKANSKIKTWALLFLAGPLWLLTIQYRNSDHILFGIDVIVYLLLASGLILINKKIAHGKLILGIFIFVFVITNISALQSWKHNRNHYYGIQKGALLSEQLQLIDRSYELANGKEFSISSSTNPHAINVTWSYLYDWYGKQKYGYVPSYYGLPQAGYPGEGLLPEITQPLSTHLTIMEPDTGLASVILKEFLVDQDLKSSTPSSSLYFGTLELQIRTLAQ